MTPAQRAAEKTSPEPADWMRKAAEEIEQAVATYSTAVYRSEPCAQPDFCAILARHRDAEVERLTQQLDAIKAAVVADEPFGRIVELMFYDPLREAEAELRRLKAEPARPDASELVEALRPFAKYAHARLETFGPHSVNAYLEARIDHVGPAGRIKASLTKADWDAARAALANREASR